MLASEPPYGEGMRSRTNVLGGKKLRKSLWVVRRQQETKDLHEKATKKHLLEARQEKYAKLQNSGEVAQVGVQESPLGCEDVALHFRVAG